MKEKLKKNKIIIIVIFAIFLIVGMVYLLVIHSGRFERVLVGTKKDQTNPTKFVIGDTSIVSADDLWMRDDQIGELMKYMVYTPLVSIQKTNGISKQLAQDLEYSDDGKTVKIQIKEAYFSDGSLLTTENLKESYEAYIYEKYIQNGLEEFGTIEGVSSYIAGEVEDIAGIKVIDDKSLQITFDEISYKNFKILEAPIVKEGKYGMIGCGEYQIEEQVPNQSIRFTRNEYTATEEFSFEELEIYYINQELQSEGLKNQTIDFLYVDMENDKQELQDAGYMDVYRLPKDVYSFVGFNQESEWFLEERKENRQDILALIPNDTLKKEYYGEKGMVPDSILPEAKAESLSLFHNIFGSKEKYTITFGASEDAYSQAFYHVLEELTKDTSLSIELESMVTELGEVNEYDLYFEGTETKTGILAYIETYLGENQVAKQNYEACVSKTLINNPLNMPQELEKFLREEAIIQPIRCGEYYIAISKSKSDMIKYLN